MTAPPTLQPAQITLGLLAGGLATRLGGVDKAWLQRDGVPQVLRLQQSFSGQVQQTLVSANRNLSRYVGLGITAIPDRVGECGPVSGLDALASACATPWLLTLPVDLVGTNECLLRTLVSSRGHDGAFAEDDDGLQPLVALWRIDALRPAVTLALQGHDHAVRRLQAGMAMACVRFAGVRFGNLNTPDALRAAGFDAVDGESSP